MSAQKHERRVALRALAGYATIHKVARVQSFERITTGCDRGAIRDKRPHRRISDRKLLKKTRGRKEGSLGAEDPQGKGRDE